MVRHVCGWCVVGLWKSRKRGGGEGCGWFLLDFKSFSGWFVSVWCWRADEEEEEVGRAGFVVGFMSVSGWFLVGLWSVCGRGGGWSGPGL